MRVSVTLIGQIINNFGTNVVKYSHIHKESNRKSWIIFFSGWVLFVIGISFDFISFAYTAQSILGAIASVQFISNLIFAHFMLKENITKYAVFGSICILIGSILIGIFGDHKSPLITTSELIKFFESIAFIIWISVLFGIGIILEIMYHIINWYFKRKCKTMENIQNESANESANSSANEEYCKYNLTFNTHENNYDFNMDELENLLTNSSLSTNRNEPYHNYDTKFENVLAFIFCFTSSVVGVQTPIIGKSISLLFRDTISGKNQFNSPYPYVLGAIFIVIGGTWIWRYNMALKRYDILYVMPVITACYIVLNIIGGGIYFQEFNNFHAIEWAVFSVGGCFIIVGIILVSLHGTKVTNET